MVDNLELRVFISFVGDDRSLVNEIIDFLDSKNMNPLLVNLKSLTRKDSTKIATLPEPVLGDVVLPIINREYVNNTWMMRELQALYGVKKDWICPIYVSSENVSVPDMRSLPSGVTIDFSKTEKFEELSRKLDELQQRLIDQQKPRNVFVVHGTDTAKRRLDVLRFLEYARFDVKILSESYTTGMKTIIEKIEEHSDVGFAIVIMTEDDVGGRAVTDLEKRARQNVLFEFGYFMGKLTRDRVFLFKDGDPAIPSDLEGLEWHTFDEHWKDQLITAMEHHFTIDRNHLRRGAL